MGSPEDFNRQVNSQMRAGRGVVVDGYSVPEGHRGINAFIRRGAARNTWETTLDGQITHREGEPVQGEARGEG